MYACGCGVHKLYSDHGGQMLVTDPLLPGLQAVVSHPTWMLGTKLRASGREANTLSC